MTTLVMVKGGLMVCRYNAVIAATVLILLSLAAGQASYANARYDVWQSERPFTLSTWITLPYSLSTQADVDYFLGSGLNTFWDGVRSGSSSWSHTDSKGLPTLLMAFQSDKVDLAGFIADFNLARAAHQNIIGVVLGDEVHSIFGPGGLEHMSAVRDWIVNNPDPSISSLLTLTSVPAGDSISSSKGGNGYWDETCDKIRPDAFVAQMYPITAGEIRHSYYSSLEWYFNWAKEKGVAMWAFPHIYSSSKQSLASESELRLQRFTSLAYGVRGFVDFLYIADGGPPSVFGAGYWDGTGSPTAIYQHLSVANREVSNIAKSLIQLTPVRAYHMDSRDDGDGVRHWSDSDADLPSWMRRTWNLANVTGAANRNRLLVGFFRDAAGEEYFLVVNKDYAKDKTSEELAVPVTLSFHPSVTGIQRLNRTTGEVETIKIKDSYSFSLPGGTGDLFKFNTGKPFAGVQQPTVPKLVKSDPAPGGTLCKLFGNSIRFNFDRDASEVTAEIKMLDEDGRETGDDLADRFERIVEDNTLVYREKGSILANKTQYVVRLYWADAPPVNITTLRGDIDGDGKISQKDKDTVTKLLGQKMAYHRADLNSDGQINETDLRYLDKIVNFREFEWTESFESCPVGPLSGSNRWVEAAAIPGSVLEKAWISADVQVVEAGGLVGGGKKAGGAHPFVWHGNETKFHDNGGFDSIGILRVGFTTRVGRGEGYQNTALHVWNSTDAEGKFGNFTVEQQRGAVIFAGGRGVKLNESLSIPLEGGQGPESKGIKVEFVIDFEASKLIIRCEDLDSGRLHGPLEVGYSGTVKGLDGLSIIADTADAQIDDIYVRNY